MYVSNKKEAFSTNRIDDCSELIIIETFSLDSAIFEKGKKWSYIFSGEYDIMSVSECLYKSPSQNNSHRDWWERKMVNPCCHWGVETIKGEKEYIKEQSRNKSLECRGNDFFLLLVSFIMFILSIPRH